jgi:ribonuclease VapC
MSQLISTTELEVVDVTATTSRLVAEAYRRWGKGFHPASLNFGDCFAYALAAERGWPLLYVGNDFAQTDIVAARPA